MENWDSLDTVMRYLVWWLWLRIGLFLSFVDISEWTDGKLCFLRLYIELIS